MQAITRRWTYDGFRVSDIALAQKRPASPLIARRDTRIDDLRTEMIDQFEHVDKQFVATHDRLSENEGEDYGDPSA
jgi:hypothetical protein